MPRPAEGHIGIAPVLGNGVNLGKTGLLVVPMPWNHRFPCPYLRNSKSRVPGLVAHVPLALHRFLSPLSIRSTVFGSPDFAEIAKIVPETTLKYL
jgi:hypothetical protein